MKNPLISVIVPVYNTAPWLRRCLDSICAQSYRNLEILCVNDGSPDNAAEILAEYAAKDERIKVFTQENAGLSAARNTGLEHASGEWITGVDSDDYLYPGIYEQAIKHCHEDVDMVFFGVQQVDEEYNLLPPNQYFSLPKDGKYELTPELAAQLNVCFVSKLWRRSLIEENALRFPVGLVHEDEAMYYIAAPYIRSIAICPTIGYAYLQRHGSIMNEGGITSLNRAKRLARILKYVHSFYKTTNNTKPNFKSYLATMFIRNCSNLFWAKPLEERDEIKKLIASVIQECDILHLDFRIDRFIPHEYRGRLSISRRGCIAIYKMNGIPIWIKLYTPHGNQINISILRRLLKKVGRYIKHQFNS